MKNSSQKRIDQMVFILGVFELLPLSHKTDVNYGKVEFENVLVRCTSLGYFSIVAKGTDQF